MSSWFPHVAMFGDFQMRQVVQVLSIHIFKVYVKWLFLRFELWQIFLSLWDFSSKII